LVVLTPGVTGLAAGGGQAYAQASGDIFNPEYGVNLNANGARSESNSFLIDSASINSSQRNGVTNVNPNAEDVQEVRIAANNFSSEFGRNGAALVNIITKQGSNVFHGSLGFYHTNNHLQARNEFQSSVPVFRRNEGAWSLGGPIWKEHTFFFTSMDFLRSGVATGRAASVATPQFINYMAQSFPNNISTYIWKTYPTTVVPTQNFVTAGAMSGANCSALASPSALIATQAGNLPCNFPVTGTGSFQSGLPRNGLQWTVRVDHTFNNNKDRLYGSFNKTTLNQVLFGAPFVYPAFNTIEPTYSVHFNMDWTHTFTPNFVNEAGASFTRPYGDAKMNDPSIPGITVIGIEGFQSGWGPNAFVQNNFEWRDVAAYTHGSHTLKFGGTVTRERADHESSRVFNHRDYSFNSVFDFATDKPFSETNIGFDPATGQRLSRLLSLIRTGSLSLFLQDDWKVKRNFTLNLGFRWEDFFNPSDAQGATGIQNITFPSGNDFTSRIRNAVITGQSHLLNHTMNTFSPRIAFAWDPSKQGKMSVRGGFGIFHDRPSNQLYDGGFTNTPRFALASATANAPPVLPVFALGTSNAPPYGFPFPPGLQTGLDAHNGLLHGRADEVVVDPNLQSMVLYNWFFGVQRSLSSNWVVEADYLGSVARHLYIRYNVNRFNGDLIQNQGIFTGLQPGFGALNYGQASQSSNYNGATFSAKKRLGHGINFDAAYTFGKAIDQSSKLDGNPIADISNMARERGLADFDVRNRLAFTSLWSLPSPSGHGFANKVLGNWELTNVTILQSGNPFRVYCTAAFKPVFDANHKVIGNTGCDYNADGTNYDIPNTPAFGNSLSGLARSDYIKGLFTASAFPAPPLGQEGDLGRNTFPGPGFANTDFSVIKNAAIPWFVGHEGAKLQFRTEFFNLFNRVNLTQVTGDLSSPFFGKASSTYGARDIQFALRIAF